MPNHHGSSRHHGGSSSRSSGGGGGGGRPRGAQPSASSSSAGSRSTRWITRETYSSGVRTLEENYRIAYQTLVTHRSRYSAEEVAAAQNQLAVTYHAVQQAQQAEQASLARTEGHPAGTQFPYSQDGRTRGADTFVQAMVQGQSQGQDQGQEQDPGQGQEGQGQQQDPGQGQDGYYDEQNYGQGGGYGH